MNILAIESSCDESALALLNVNKGIVGEWVASQALLQKEYGGIVPDLASREHLKNFPVLLEELMVHPAFSEVSKVGVTYGPGLAPALAMGVSLAQALCFAKGWPLFGVNHLRGHAFSPFIELFEENPKEFKKIFGHFLPHLGLIASGGNTILFVITKDIELKIISQTVDDAAGEALDKGARLLGLDYPGGALIEQHAKLGNAKAYAFPKAMQKDLDFSFSGLKTALRYLLEKISKNSTPFSLQDLCASYQKAVLDQLVDKTYLALQRGTFKSLGLSGGVSNNKNLREGFLNLAQKTNIPLFLAKPIHTGDNAAMIAFAMHIDPLVLPASNLSLPICPVLELA